MDGLVQDFHSALDESVDPMAAAAVSPSPPLPLPLPTPHQDPSQSAVKGSATPARRRAWRRRCKSTSNLSSLPNAGDDSSSTEDEAGLSILQQQSSHKPKSRLPLSKATTSVAVPMSGAGGGDRGTSSLQMSDSDDLSTTTTTTTTGGNVATVVLRNKCQRDNSVRKKRSSYSGAAVAAAESDSVNENLSSGVGGAMDAAVASAAASTPPFPFSSNVSSPSPAVAVAASVRPNTKRKRKFKRMAVDPNAASSLGSAATADAGGEPPSGPSSLPNSSSAGKRPKVRNRLYYYYYSPTQTPPESTAISATGVAKPFFVPGKRKRSAREKSVEPELHFKMDSGGAEGVCDDGSAAAASAVQAARAGPHWKQEALGSRFGRSRAQDRGNEKNMMDCDTSSLSSSDWEDAAAATADSAAGQGAVVGGDATGVDDDQGAHADDEQSDWPGHYDDESSFSSSGRRGDEDEDDIAAAAAATATAHYSDLALSNFFAPGQLDDLPLTSTARQTYLARMKRLAECVPGREIRAGARKLHNNRQSGFTIKSSSSEQLSRFLQDPSRAELRLTVARQADRSKVIHLANLYSLSVRSDAGSDLLVLSKTLKTVRLKDFGSPSSSSGGSGAGAGGGCGVGIGAACGPSYARQSSSQLEFKRRRRTPPPPPPGSPPSWGLGGGGGGGSGAGGTVAAAMDAVAAAALMPQPDDDADEDMRAEEGGEVSPLLPPLLNRSESPVLGAATSTEARDKAKFSGSLSS